MTTFSSYRQRSRSDSRLDPEVELIALEQPGRRDACASTSTIPTGSTSALCERVTGQLRDLLEAYSLEVSSPGLDRPLTKPEHFRRFLGRTVRVRTREPIDGQRNFTGTLDRRRRRDASRVDADGDAVRDPARRRSAAPI